MAEETATAPTGAELTAREKKAARERARRAFQKSLREQAAAAAAPTNAAPAGAESAPPTGDAPPAPSSARGDDDRARDLAVFLRGVVYPILAVVALFTPWRLDLSQFTDADAAEEARAWVPLARRYAWLDNVCTWASAPARMVQTVRRIARRKDAAPGVVLPMARPEEATR